MDPQEKRPKSPSLLDGDAQAPASRETSPRILADMKGGGAVGKTRQRKPRRWFWPVLVGIAALVVVALLVIGGMFPLSESTRPYPAAAQVAVVSSPSIAPVAVAPAPTSAVPTQATVASAPTSVSSSPSAAVILRDDGSRVVAVTAAPASAASAAAQAQAASELKAAFAPPSPTKLAKTAKTVVRKRAHASAPRDSDVDLLTVLMKHLEAGESSPDAARTSKPSGTNQH